MISKLGWVVSGSLLLQGLYGLVPDRAVAQTAPANLISDVGGSVQQAAEEKPAGGEARTGAGTSAEGGDQVMVGPFSLDAGVTVSQGYSDNVYATRNDKIGDGLVVITPELSLSTENLPVEVDLKASAEIGRYWHETSENYEDFNFGLDTTYRLAPQSIVFGGASFGRDHEDRQSPDDVSGTEPTLYYDTQAYVGTADRFDRVTLRAGGTFERLNYDDVPAVGGAINNDDRDRNLYTAGARLGYLVSPSYEVFGQGFYDRRDYDAARDDNGFHRDSNGFSAAVGLRYRPSRTLDIEGTLGYLGQYYDDPALESITAPDFGFRLEWLPQAATRIKGFVDRTVQETTLSGASGYLSTGYGLSLSQQLRADISLETSLSYYEDDYEGIGREDNTLDFAIGARYYVTPNIFVGPNYSFLQRDSTVANDDYDEHQVYFSVGAKLAPAYTSDELDASPPVEANLGGLYGGVQGSLTNLGTALEGPRGSGGSLTAEFADMGFGGGLFAGYGLRAGDWQFGLEVDGELSDAGWDHERDSGGRVFSVDKTWSVSAGPVVGYWLNPDSMIYGRFGVVQTGFDTRYVEGDRFDQSNSRTGLRFGLGADTTLTGNFFLRLDYSYTSYEDYDIAYGGGRSDNFANSESLVRLGLGYRFPDGTKQAEETPRSDEAGPEGFYLGLAGGHNALDSKNTGDRQGGSVLTADAGEAGATGGLFGGYGVVWRNIYLGAEAEAELSNAGWDREREPTGRIFSVDKQGGFGGALRAGYVLPGGALAYGRAGLMYSSFDTKVKTTGNSFEDNEMLLGVRLGMGLELPISQSVFARMEYSYTDYQHASLATGSGPEEFKNSEGLFRAAVGFRF